MVKRSGNETASPEGRLKRLARNIEALAKKDDEVMRHARDIVALRRTAAAELYALCCEFVNSLNRHLSATEIGLDPSDFPDDAFQEHISNLIQINVRGRILQVEFEATPDLISTEDFRIPYTLQGYVRAFNQALLDKDLIEEQLIFYTLEGDKKLWRFFDARTYRSGALDQEYLISLMEELV
jgi:hypothetical protein